MPPQAPVPLYHFISGLPRSSSTLLAAILRQNPRFHAGMTSPVGALVSGLVAQVSAGSEFATMVDGEQRRTLVRGIFDAYYHREHEKAVIFDTNRHWCAKLNLVLEQFPSAKVIACVRNVAWVMDSFERLYRANPYEHTKLFANGGRSTVQSRLEGLAQHDNVVGFAWAALREAYYGPLAESLLLVDYDLLATVPQKVLPIIYDFIGEPEFVHDFDQVHYDAHEFDAQLGVPGLHQVRSKVSLEPRRTILPPDLFETYSKMSFWNDTASSAAHVITVKAQERALVATS
ncbi:MAG: sulfotransferase [Cyanobacteria bacterium]|nr:sulfotransferase [Cyanobacteriota bacterium]